MLKTSMVRKGSSVQFRQRASHKTPAKHDKNAGQGNRRFKRLPTKLPTLLVLTASLLLAGCYMPEGSAAMTCNHYVTPAQAIKCVFPKSLRQTATRIAQCESTALAPERVARRYKLGRWAKNGQYVGVFQMGKRERKRYGFYRRGASALIQVESAYQLYLDRGWSPWQCA